MKETKIDGKQMMAMGPCKPEKSRLDDKDETISQETEDGPALNK